MMPECFRVLTARTGDDGSSLERNCEACLHSSGFALEVKRFGTEFARKRGSLYNQEFDYT